MHKSIKNLTLCILLSSITFYNSCGFKENVNYDGKESNEIPNIQAIKNFSKYTGIGIIDLHNSNESRSSSSENGFKLIGTYEDSEENITDYDVVDFLSDDGTSKQDFFIKNYHPIGDRFLFLQFTKNKKNFSKQGFMYSDESNPVFLLDKTSGKVYKIPTKGTHTFEDVTGNTIYFVLREESTSSIYKMTIQESHLIVEEILSEPTLVGDAPRIVADIYNNLFVNDCYIITSNRKLKKTDKEFNYFYEHKNIDGKIWTEEQNNYYYYNENSELTLSTKHPSSLQCFSYFKKDEFDHLIYKDNLDYYYLGNGELITGSVYCEPNIRSGEIIKLSYTSQEKTDCIREDFLMEEIGENPIIINNRIYMMNQSEIFYITITDGKKHTIASGDYVLKSISTDGLGNIYFTGLDYNLQNISGIIEPDGTIKTNITPSEYIVIYLSPLN